MSGPAGRLRLVGRLTDASNATFLAADEAEAHWVYKPVAGEAPLWDFPEATLSRREVAAYAVSEALGFGVVPTTVWCDGPLGEGSAQAWVEGEPTDLIGLLPPEELTADWLPVLAVSTEDGDPLVLAHRDDPRLRAVALFDVLVNNADRKASHLIADGDAVRGVDHGVSLHVDPKLRTVLWGWTGDQLTAEELALVKSVASLGAPLAPGLDDEEWAALVDRASGLFAAGEMPRPGRERPAIPWPPL